VDVALDLMIHDADPRLICCHRVQRLWSARRIPGLQPEPDYVLAQLSFPACPIVSDRLARTEQKVRAIDVTTHGLPEADLLNKSILVHRRSFGNICARITTASNIARRVSSSGSSCRTSNHLGEIQHFLQCIMDGSEPRISARKGLETLRLTHQIRDAVFNSRQACQPA
jgi:predicted dehydrogenase